MNRMFVVSTGVNSWCGCLRPPCGGTLAIVPSRIFSSACCTPSPETSRVIEGFSSFLADLVDFVDIDDALLRLGHVAIGGLQQLQNDVLDVLADVARLRSASWRPRSRTEHPACAKASAPAASCPCRSARSAECCDLVSSTSPGCGSGRFACSGCKRRRPVSSSFCPARSRSRPETALISGGRGSR